MNDLRARLAAIVERDRRRHGELGVDVGGAAGTETLSTREIPSLRDGDPSRAGSLGARAATALPFSVFEQRIAIDDLGLEIVGRGACDALLLA
ncbi:MAG TPA: hypothetical protein VI056_08975, partial [Candidatus Limnocylindria bacterium]